MNSTRLVSSSQVYWKQRVPRRLLYETQLECQKQTWKYIYIIINSEIAYTKVSYKRDEEQIKPTPELDEYDNNIIRLYMIMRCK